MVSVLQHHQCIIGHDWRVTNEYCCHAAHQTLSMYTIATCSSALKLYADPLNLGRGIPSHFDDDSMASSISLSSAATPSVIVSQEVSPLAAKSRNICASLINPLRTLLSTVEGIDSAFLYTEST